MTANVAVIELDNELIAALEVMEKGQFNHLPVVQNKKLVGIISMTDIKRIKYLSEFADDKVTSNATFQIFDIEEVMTTNPNTVDEETSIREVAQIFAKVNYHALPVLANGELIGIVSIKDILTYYSEA